MKSKVLKEILNNCDDSIREIVEKKADEILKINTMETLYRKVAVSDPSQFENNKYYHFVDFDGNIQGDCFFNYASFDEYTQRYKYFLVESPDPTAQLQADKAELLEALEEMYSKYENDGHLLNVSPSKIKSLIQKHKI